jgi:hypothetical protein
MDDGFKRKKKTWAGIERRARESALCHFEEKFTEPGRPFHFDPFCKLFKPAIVRSKFVIEISLRKKTNVALKSPGSIR